MTGLNHWWQKYQNLKVITNEIRKKLIKDKVLEKNCSLEDLISELVKEK